MKKMKHLIVCSTPIQIITAINLRVSELANDDVVLYILDHSHMNEEIYKQVSRAELFTKVYFLKTKAFNQHWLQKNKITRYFVNTAVHLNYERTLARIVDDVTIYDKLWISYMDRSSQLFFLTHKKRNKELDLYFFEDGLGSYGMLNAKQNQLKQKLFHILGINSSFEVMQAMYVYEPTLVFNKLYPSIEIRPLPKIANNESIKNLLNSIFSFEISDLELLNYKYIFFDSAISGKEIQVKQLEILDFLTVKLGNSLCVKLHPRTILEDRKYRGNVSKIRAAMEILCMNTDVSQNVFISIISTVGTTPKLMFDQEPVVIFLYKVVGLDLFRHLPNEYFKFIEAFAKTYKNPNRVFIPNTIEELEKILQNLSMEDNIALELKK